MGSTLIWVRATRPINAKSPSGERVFQPGELFQANPEKARPLIEAGILRTVEAVISPPIRPGWVVAYLGHAGEIQGGTIAEAVLRGSTWTFTLADGGELRENEILSVGAIEGGRWVGAWTVRNHGLNGKRVLGGW